LINKFFGFLKKNLKCNTPEGFEKNYEIIVGNLKDVVRTGMEKQVIIN
jgi:hypothetical protein